MEFPSQSLRNPKIFIGILLALALLLATLGSFLPFASKYFGLSQNIGYLMIVIFLILLLTLPILTVKITAPFLVVNRKILLDESNITVIGYDEKKNFYDKKIYEWSSLASYKYLYNERAKMSTIIILLNNKKKLIISNIENLELNEVLANSNSFFRTFYNLVELNNKEAKNFISIDKGFFNTKKGIKILWIIGISSLFCFIVDTYFQPRTSFVFLTLGAILILGCRNNDKPYLTMFYRIKSIGGIPE